MKEVDDVSVTDAVVIYDAASLSFYLGCAAFGSDRACRASAQHVSVHQQQFLFICMTLSLYK